MISGRGCRTPQRLAGAVLPSAAGEHEAALARTQSVDAHQIVPRLLVRRVAQPLQGEQRLRGGLVLGAGRLQSLGVSGGGGGGGAGGAGRRRRGIGLLRRGAVRLVLQHDVAPRGGRRAGRRELGGGVLGCEQGGADGGAHPTHHGGHRLLLRLGGPLRPQALQVVQPHPAQKGLDVAGQDKLHAAALDGVRQLQQRREREGSRAVSGGQQHRLALAQTRPGRAGRRPALASGSGALRTASQSTVSVMATASSAAAPSRRAGQRLASDM